MFRHARTRSWKGWRIAVEQGDLATGRQARGSPSVARVRQKELSCGSRVFMKDGILPAKKKKEVS
jgi:hypothetical protein